jgi:UDP-N-acetylglucosamine--N-acetylmuramyl-(pentapeptide) pyrophosphoryl-undecaprenol N-acetylglucosamine transferase
MIESLRVAIAGGGTGGHAMPALAVAGELRRQRPQAELIYIGASGSIEERLAKAENIDFYSVPIKPLRRGVIFQNFMVPFLAVWSVAKAAGMLKRNGVKFVFGSGGFSSWPACGAARLTGVRYFLADGNAFPGLVTRLLAGKASRIYIAFEAIRRRLKMPAEKFLLSGYPVSGRLREPVSKEDARRQLGLNPETPCLLVTGGSGGSKTINNAINSAIPQLLEDGCSVIWQCGKQWGEIPTRESWQGRVLCERFLEPARMATAITAADVAVTRCGIMTLSELAVAGIPSVLVPFPFSAEGHQEANARAIEEAGGGIVILDRDLTADSLRQGIQQIRNGDRYPAMVKAMKAASRPDAARMMVEDMLRIADA